MKLISLILRIIFVTALFLPTVKAQELDTLVDVGIYKLHFHIFKGEGTPILFDSGGGNEGNVWYKLIEKLRKSKHLTCITFDRAGMGISSIDTAHITISEEIKGLHTALEKLGYNQQIFLVAHSFGGAYATIFSAKYPEMVRGGVFIDISLSCFLTPDRAKSMAIPYQNDLSAIKNHALGTYFLIKNYEKYAAVLRNTAFPTKIPLTVISSDYPPLKGIDSIPWKSCQQEFGKLPNHKFVLASKCGHYIYDQNPVLVANEISKLYRKTSKVSGK